MGEYPLIQPGTTGQAYISSKECIEPEPGKGNKAVQWTIGSAAGGPHVAIARVIGADGTPGGPDTYYEGEPGWGISGDGLIEVPSHAAHGDYYFQIFDGPCDWGPEGWASISGNFSVGRGGGWRYDRD